MVVAAAAVLLGFLNAANLSILNANLQALHQNLANRNGGNITSADIPAGFIPAGFLPYGPTGGLTSPGTSANLIPQAVPATFSSLPQYSFEQLFSRQDAANATTPAPGTPPASPSLSERIQALPDRISNRIQSIGNYFWLPNFNTIGQPRPRPNITEPAWVADVLGPTTGPVTTPEPTITDRVRNSFRNVLLFVPATLFNFWHDVRGVSVVDRVVQQLQGGTPQPQKPEMPVYAPKPASNFNATEALINATNYDANSLQAIINLLNSNSSFLPTILYPVVNMTTNTTQYQLRSAYDTAVLWTEDSSNDPILDVIKETDNQGENLFRGGENEQEQQFLVFYIQ